MRADRLMQRASLADRPRMSQVSGSLGPWRIRAAAAIFASVMVAACGGTPSANGTTTAPSLPRLTSSVQYSGVRFSVPAGFSFVEVDQAASTSGYMLDIPGQQGKIDCSEGKAWEATSVFFTSVSNVQGVSGSLHQATLDHGLSVQEDPVTASGIGCQYVTQHVVIPNLNLGMAISGVGVTATSALALAREIVASATPTPSKTPG